jgi:hypothetical protein
MAKNNIRGPQFVRIFSPGWGRQRGIASRMGD